MASGWNVLPCAIVAALFWTCIGWPLSRRLTPTRALGLSVAPALGWAVFNAVALPIFLLIGFSAITLIMVAGIALVLSLADMIGNPEKAPNDAAMRNLPIWAWAAAALVAIVPALAIMPKFGGGGVLLSVPMFDHSKIAIIDDIARHGLPPGNPFMDVSGASAGLAYYYLWHFSAAAFPILLGVSGWEADIGLTWFTAFASLLLMMGLAVWFGRRQSAAWWVLLLSISVSFRPLLVDIFGAAAVDHVLSSHPVVQSWLIQATWVPQHLAGANSVVLAFLLAGQILERRLILVIPTLALVVVAGFESSTWIGGIVMAVAGVPLGIALLWSAKPEKRWTLLARAAGAGFLALLIAAPFIRDQFLATAARDAGVPIGWRPYEVFGPLIPDAWRRALDLPGYWLVLLPLKLPSIFITGSIALVAALRVGDEDSARRRSAILLAILSAAGFAIAWLFASTIANNDLGWRAILPGIMVLTVFAAAGMSRWMKQPASWPAVGAVALLALGLPDGIHSIVENARGFPSSKAALFAESPAMWAAVRRHAGVDERVANNPGFLDGAVWWPVNISWAILADRRSCFASWELVRAYVARPGEELQRLDTMFARIFAGDGTSDDLDSLAHRYKCRVVLITPGDGAWRHDEFATSPFYRLVEDNPGAWRIYRSVDTAPGAS